MKVKRTMNRIKFLRIVSMAVFLIVFGRVGWLQIVRAADLSEEAITSRITEKRIEPKRGDIVDVTGKVVATTVDTRTVFVDPQAYQDGVKKLKDDPKEKIKRLADILQLKQDEVQAKFNAPSRWVPLARKVEISRAEEIKSLELPGIGFAPDKKRVYPMGSLMASLLGIVKDEGRGGGGIELWYDNELFGEQGAITEETDARSRSLLGGLHTFSPPKDGNNLTLTIDTSIQYIVEQQLDELMANSLPKSATVIVMEPKTGKILAMGNRPSFDPNSYTKYPKTSWQNPAVSSQYEPGSTFKIITASTAVEEGTTSANKIYNDPGYLVINNQRITNWDSGKSVLGPVPLIKGMEQSSNVVLGKVGLELSRETFFKYIRGFGFGQLTGIDLPGEAAGTLLKEQRTTQFEQATMAFGQANAATPLQMITAVSAVANGGTLFRPYVVEKITDSQGNLIKENKPVPVRQVVSKYTSEQLKVMLESVVANGTGGNAKIEGYRIAGKTGTAQKVEDNGKYSEDHYIASFIGFAPANDPRIAVLVIVDSASKGAFRGGEIAAPRFKAIVEQTLQYLNVPRSSKTSEPPLEVTPANRPTAKPFVPERKPAPGEGAVPDLTGRTMSEVGEMLSKQGLRMNFVGSGLAVSQDYPPGKVVTAGTVITVKFEP